MRCRAGTGRNVVPGYSRENYPRVLGYPMLLFPIKLKFLALVSSYNMNQAALKSQVWQFFSLLQDKQKTQCNFCNIELSYRGGGTSSMKKHLEFKHPMQLRKRSDDSLSTNPESNGPVTKQTKLDGKRTEFTFMNTKVRDIHIFQIIPLLNLLTCRCIHALDSVKNKSIHAYV